MWIAASKYRKLAGGLALSAALFALPAAADILGEPTIIDGDSLELQGRRFDLFGIDSPEPGTSCWKENGDSFDCGHIATTALLDLTAGMDVACVPKGDVAGSNTAVTPALCTAGGFSLNRNMVHTGWAVADRTVASDYLATEAEARAAKRGLWRWKIPSPPWPSR